MFSLVFSSDDSDFELYSMLGVSAILGIVLAILLIKTNKLHWLVCGAFFGASAGFQAYNVGLYMLETESGKNYWLCLAIAVCAILGALIGYCFNETITIIATSMGGSYIAVKLIGCLIGNYPDEMIIAYRIKMGEFDTMPIWSYIYFSAAILLGLLGIGLQCRSKNHAKRQREEKERQYYEQLI